MKDYVQIKIGRHMSGIIGLKQALEETGAMAHDLEDGDIAKLLVKKLSKKNFITSNVTDLYEAALLREYKKHIGVRIEDEPLEGLEIKVLGGGCPTCDHLVRELMTVIEETGIEAGIEHVRDQ